ncbi:hypothetical protein CDAR_174411 [Caerostris darwini]|uniref:Prolactin receptor n=1 Tax=Caerostris darwini TaxID=1538125 RepID=A0AAV4PFI6_9ARAC|nr:hypothetical protein CDAR_174411 [Caerostris darwini]
MPGKNAGDVDDKPSRQKTIHQKNADPLSPQKARANCSSLSRNAQKFDADHCSSHHVHPGSRHPKSNDRAHATLIPPTKTNEDSALPSVFVIWQGDPPPTSHALARAQCMAGPANGTLKWGMPGKNGGDVDDKVCFGSGNEECQPL